MKCEKFIKLIGEIDEKYVMEYLEMPIKRFSIDNKYIKKMMVVASIMLLIGVIAIQMINNQTESAFEYKARNFISYEEFCAVLPENNLLENIERQEEITYHYMGFYENVDSDKFSTFSVTALRDKKVLTNIEYELSPHVVAERYANLHVLDQIITINGTTIYYAYNVDEEYYEAVFMNGKDFYKVQHHVKNEQEVLEIVKDILE